VYIGPWGSRFRGLFVTFASWWEIFNWKGMHDVDSGEFSVVVTRTRDVERSTDPIHAKFQRRQPSKAIAIYARLRSQFHRLMLTPNHVIIAFSAQTRIRQSSSSSTLPRPSSRNLPLSPSCSQVPFLGSYTPQASTSALHHPAAAVP